MPKELKLIAIVVVIVYLGITAYDQKIFPFQNATGPGNA